MVDTARNLVLSQRNFTGNSLMTSGLFLMKKNKDGSRRQLMKVYDIVKEYVEKGK